MLAVIVGARKLLVVISNMDLTYQNQTTNDKCRGRADLHREISALPKIPSPLKWYQTRDLVIDINVNPHELWYWKSQTIIRAMKEMNIERVEQVPPTVKLFL